MVKSDELLNALVEAVMVSIKITIVFPTTKIRRNDSEQSKATDSYQVKLINFVKLSADEFYIKNFHNIYL